MNYSSGGFGGFGKEHQNYKDIFTKSNRGKWKKWLIVFAILALLAVVLGSAYNFLMEYWQIQEIGEGFTSVFWKNLFAKLLTQGVWFLLTFVFLSINLFILKRLVLEKQFDMPLLKKRWPYFLLSLVLSLFFARYAGGMLHEKLLMAIYGESFGISDPLFSKDIGYYIFSRPFLISLVSGGKSLLMTLLIISAAVYFLVFVKRGHRSLKEVIMAEKGALLHVVVLAIAYFLLSMATYTFSAENVMYASFGSQNDIFGAGYVEAGVWRQYYRFAPVIILLTVFLVLFFLYRKKYLFSLGSLAIVPIVFILVSLGSFVVDSFVVSPNERNLQMPYIAHNMEATRQAFGLSDVSEVEFDPEYEMDQSVIAEDDTWLAGTRITDYGSTLTAYNQLQFLRKYYSFRDVDAVPYELDGKLNVVFLAARELNKDNLDVSAQSYANRVFRYTHGFGAVASPVNRVTAEGQPEFLIKDIPPRSTGGMPEVTEPRIYYGELTNDYVIVGGENRELDYSEGLEDIQFTYDGDSGISLGFFKRLMFSWHYKDYRMLLSGNVGSDSKILINRNVLGRVKRVAPFFSYDNDPYLVVTESGQLYWVLNAYTTSSNYPYSQPYANVNYVRNSVMVTVNAYDGTVAFYLTDESDPLARAYRKMYPGLFETEAMPAEIAAHVRVPEYLFKLQAQVYQRYHVKDAGQFYDRADVWDIANEKYQENEIPMEPYYNIMEIDGRDEMVLMLPFVVQGKHNMVGLLVQRNAPEHYGELLLYRFPKNETVYGPLQIENRIDNDPDISREMTLWGQGGSSVIRGNLLVVPYRHSLLYVEPIYITSQNNASLPELKRIVVAYGEAIAMEPTLEGALRSVFAKGSVAPEAEQVPPLAGVAPSEGEIAELETIISDLLNQYDRFKESAKSQDWKSMGEQMEQLEDEMERLRQAKGE